ncbi:MAG: cupin domain-containing protein [Rhodobacteraceae bacterium]|nr:cupin domain-containing protein [Paracoccaceae bacterium]
MEVFPVGTSNTVRGNPEWFIGRVWITRLCDTAVSAPLRTQRIVYEPSARSAWHSHPLGQVVHIIGGVGLFGRRGFAPRIARAGETVWIPAGQEHWHGAAPDCLVEHIEVQQAQAGYVSTWMEYVCDEDYLQPPG